MDLKVGCCGFPVAHKNYYLEFRVVELQSTFYQLPQKKTAIRWREEASPGFEFTVKAWQAITHPPSSPTWHKVKSPSGAKTKYGLLKPTRENFDAWDATLEICRLLRAKVCVIQCPAIFACRSQNILNMRKFFGKIDRDGIIIAWEPRGNWIDNTQQIEQICKELDLVHCVDLLRRGPACTFRTGYFRLHGLGSKELNYSYKYSRKDLSSLSERLSSLAEKDLNQAYVMFNNISMFCDAKRFLNGYVS